MVAAVHTGASAVVQDFALRQSAQPLEQVVVTGTLVPTEVKALPTPITIITADDPAAERNAAGSALSGASRRRVRLGPAGRRSLQHHQRPGCDFPVHPIGQDIHRWHRGGRPAVHRPDRSQQHRAHRADPRPRKPRRCTARMRSAGCCRSSPKRERLVSARPDGEIKTSASLIEKNDGPGVAARLEECHLTCAAASIHPVPGVRHTTAGRRVDAELPEYQLERDRERGKRPRSR